MNRTLKKTSATNDISKDELPVAETFLSIQGEGFNSGRAAYFIRLAGCRNRCAWCDSKETWDVSKARMEKIETLVNLASGSGAENIVITGGEPLIHNLNGLCKKLREKHMNIFLETSGTEKFSGNFDWIALSPKEGKKVIAENYELADELKMVICTPEDFSRAEINASMVRKRCRLYLQPEWESRNIILPEIIEYIKGHPSWSISLQLHKLLDIR
ncbi:MAG: 7-carboxy-7-deazaguanine synthase QueE [Bacteroidales bacterium]|nr:7-carboxy-7-deazaguanine synthase QueE [Bacteroidales bacterium]